MITRREAALRLDISVEMARRHGIAAKISETDLAELDENPPPWLAQSRANRTGKKAVWVRLRCDVCGFEESVRPKKWWPEFTYLTCDHHSIGDIPPARGRLQAQRTRRHRIAVHRDHRHSGRLKHGAPISGLGLQASDFRPRRAESS